MAPILIDGRGLYKLGFTAVVITALIFFSGFFTGYKKAADFYAYTSKSKPLQLPAVAENEPPERDPQEPEVVSMGENIDVDQPENNPAENSHHATNHDVESLAAATTETDKSDIKKYPITVLAEKSDATSVMPEHSKSSVKITEKPEITSVDIKNARYSIQIGMYGNIINAENMMNMLQAQKLNAYISDYKNKKGETRYNVRFGYFQTKRSALTTLSEFKSQGKGDGYLVRFSADNLVKIAGGQNAISTQPDNKSPANTDAIDEGVDHEKLHKLPQAKLSQAKLTQAGLVQLTSPVSY